MSYSRWIQSVWYTFYSYSNSIERDEQVFEICGVISFTYGELKKDIEACLTKVAQLCTSDTNEYLIWRKGWGYGSAHFPQRIPASIAASHLVMKTGVEITTPEFLELKGYMQEFMVDVEHDIALNLVQDIKRAKIEDLPELHRYLTDQVAKCYNLNDYADLLEDLDKILNKAGTEKTDLKTDIGRQLFDKKKLIPQKNRFELLKKDS